MALEFDVLKVEDQKLHFLYAHENKIAFGLLKTNSQQFELEVRKRVDDSSFVEMSAREIASTIRKFPPSTNATVFAAIKVLFACKSSFVLILAVTRPTKNVITSRLA